jgi:hypothetical protein
MLKVKGRAGIGDMAMPFFYALNNQSGLCSPLPHFSFHKPDKPEKIATKPPRQEPKRLEYFHLCVLVAKFFFIKCREIIIN